MAPGVTAKGEDSSRGQEEVPMPAMEVKGDAPCNFNLAQIEFKYRGKELKIGLIMRLIKAFTAQQLSTKYLNSIR